MIRISDTYYRAIYGVVKWAIRARKKSAGDAQQETPLCVTRKSRALLRLCHRRIAASTACAAAQHGANSFQQAAQIAGF